MTELTRSQHFTFCEALEPEFWFGERVTFCWNDENDGLPYSETGEVVGVVWNQPENQWEYIVTWLSSDAYPSENYPIFDGNLVPAEILCKLDAGT